MFVVLYYMHNDNSTLLERYTCSEVIYDKVTNTYVTTCRTKKQHQQTYTFPVNRNGYSSILRV